MPLDWSKLLSDPKILALLEKMVSGGIESLQPSVNLEGQIVYREINDIVGNDAAQFLETLSKAGIMERKSETRILGCPSHEDSFDLNPRLRCPTCSSMLLRKGTLYQHTCGYIGAEETFGQTCPKCGKAAPAQSRKLMGGWYECDSCKNRFAAPNLYLYCSKYNHDFPIQQARLVDQSSYRLTPAASTDLKERLGIIIRVMQGLLASGYKVEISGTLLGVSGVEHSFDLVIEDGSNKVPVDLKVSSEGPVGVVTVLGTYAKALDTKSKASVLIAVPNASEDAKKSISAYGMILVEGRDAGTITQTLISSLRREKPQEAEARTP